MKKELVNTEQSQKKSDAQEVRSGTDCKKGSGAKLKDKEDNKLTKKL